MATTAQKLVSEVTTDRLIIDMADAIEELDPNAGPLVLLLRKLNSAPCTQEKIEWMESELEDRWDTVVTTQANTTTLGVNSTGIWHKWDIGIIPESGFKFIVTSDVDNGYLEILELDAGDGADDVATDENVLKLGNALDEGGEAVDPYEGTVTTVTNYVQIFEQSWQVSESLMHSALYGGDELARLTANKRIEHERDIESILFFGERATTTNAVNSQVGPVHLLGGVEYFLNASQSGAHVTDVAGSLSESTWTGWLGDLYTYQSDKPRYVFASYYLLKALSTWAGGKLKLVPSDKTYGIAINEYLHPFGAPCYLLNARRMLSYGEETANVAYEGYNFGLCLDELKLRPQEGLNTQIKTNIQDPGSRRRRDKITSYLSLEVRLPELHGILHGITGIA